MVRSDAVSYGIVRSGTVWYGLITSWYGVVRGRMERNGVVRSGTGWYVMLWCGTEWYRVAHPALGVQSILLVNDGT